jgi:hypothetical protein
MRPDENQPEPQIGDDPIEQALDRLGALVAPSESNEREFVLHVMQRIGDSPAPRRRHRASLIARLAVIAAACVIAALVFWRSTSAQRHAPEIVDSKTLKEKAKPVSLPAEVAPAMRTSTWSTVSESVVIENDVPVRKLFYREFERVELVDAQGKTEGEMVVPTKAMLVATKEQY